MTDVETQASQRTVVAFISGLLIGGLLVWMFSPAPKDMEPTQKEDTAKTENTEKDTKDGDATSSETGASTATNGRALSVANQEAGSSVTLERVAYPDQSGWVVVREYANGTPGNVLGAARYDVALGLQPGTVNLVRPTVAGGTYEALFYSNEGARSFDLGEDMPVVGISAQFKAE
jgi:hypothetical protein